MSYALKWTTAVPPKWFPKNKNFKACFLPDDLGCLRPLLIITLYLLSASRWTKNFSEHLKIKFPIRPSDFGWVLLTINPHGRCRAFM